MERKMCVLDDEKECDGCLECEVCDLDPSKICDNCGKCKAAVCGGLGQLAADISEKSGLLFSPACAIIILMFPCIGKDERRGFPQAGNPD